MPPSRWGRPRPSRPPSIWRQLAECPITRWNCRLACELPIDSSTQCGKRHAETCPRRSPTNAGDWLTGWSIHTSTFTANESLCEFLVDLGMRPVYVVTGTPGKQFERRLNGVLHGKIPEVKVRHGTGADMFLLHQWIKQEKVDLLIGNTYGKYIARDDDIPLVRHGFPILDRTGHQYFPTVGYQGAMRIAEKILCALQDRQDRDCPEEAFELTM